MEGTMIVVKDLMVSSTMVSREATRWEMVQVAEKISKILLRLGFTCDVKIRGEKE